MNPEKKDKLIKAIMKTGYPTELKVVNCFKKRKWNISCNRYFVDRDERKGREVDICGYKNLVKNDPIKLMVGVHVIGEVKQSRSKPWIIFSTEAAYYEFGLGYGRLHYSQKISNKILPYKKIEQYSGNASIINKRIGRSYCEGFNLKQESQTIFRALTSAVKASEYFLERNEQASKQHRDPDEHIIVFLEPVVIVEGELYEAYLNANDEIEITEVSNIPVSFGYVSPSYKKYNHRVQIIDLPYLPSYLAQKERWIDELGKIIISNISKEKKK